MKTWTIKEVITMAKSAMLVKDLIEMLSRAPQEAKVHIHIDDDIGLLRGEMSNGAWDSMNEPHLVHLVAIRIQP